MSKAEKKTPSTKNVNKLPEAKGEHHPLLGLRQEVDSLFDNFFSNFSLGPFGRNPDEFNLFPKMSTATILNRGFTPSMDVTETDDEFLISAELPGMNEKDIDLSLTDGQLVIKGEKKDERETKEEGRHLMERHYGSIYRSMPLPEGIDEDTIDATYDKGILSITVKKTEGTKKETRRVEVKTK